MKCMHDKWSLTISWAKVFMAQLYIYLFGITSNRVIIFSIMFGTDNPKEEDFDTFLPFETYIVAIIARAT